MNEVTDLDLQKIISTNALIVHLVVSVIGIATALILNECKPVYRVSDSSANYRANLGYHTDGLQQCEAPGYRNEPDGHSCKFIISP